MNPRVSPVSRHVPLFVGKNGLTARSFSSGDGNVSKADGSLKTNFDLSNLDIVVPSTLAAAQASTSLGEPKIVKDVKNNATPKRIIPNGKMTFDAPEAILVSVGLEPRSVHTRSNGQSGLDRREAFNSSQMTSARVVDTVDSSGAIPYPRRTNTTRSACQESHSAVNSSGIMNDSSRNRYPALRSRSFSSDTSSSNNGRSSRLLNPGISQRSRSLSRDESRSDRPHHTSLRNGKETLSRIDDSYALSPTSSSSLLSPVACNSATTSFSTTDTFSSVSTSVVTLTSVHSSAPLQVSRPAVFTSDTPKRSTPHHGLSVRFAESVSTSPSSKLESNGVKVTGSDYKSSSTLFGSLSHNDDKLELLAACSRSDDKGGSKKIYIDTLKKQIDDISECSRRLASPPMLCKSRLNGGEANSQRFDSFRSTLSDQSPTANGQSSGQTLPSLERQPMRSTASHAFGYHTDPSQYKMDFASSKIAPGSFVSSMISPTSPRDTTVPTHSPVYTNIKEMSNSNTDPSIYNAHLSLTPSSSLSSTSSSLSKDSSQMPPSSPSAEHSLGLPPFTPRRSRLSSGVSEGHPFSLMLASSSSSSSSLLPPPSSSPSSSSSPSVKGKALRTVQHVGPYPSENTHHIDPAPSNMSRPQSKSLLVSPNAGKPRGSVQPPSPSCSLSAFMADGSFSPFLSRDHRVGSQTLHFPLDFSILQSLASSAAPCTFGEHVSSNGVSLLEKRLPHLSHTLTHPPASPSSSSSSSTPISPNTPMKDAESSKRARLLRKSSTDPRSIKESHSLRYHQVASLEPSSSPSSFSTPSNSSSSLSSSSFPPKTISESESSLASLIKKESIAASYHLEHCWFCGRPMPPFGTSLSGGEEHLEKLAELEKLLAQAQSEKIKLVEEQVRIRESEMLALQKNEVLERELQEVRLREKNSQIQARPMTRFLPNTSRDFDLRAHVEGAGHQLDACPHVIITSHSCRGWLQKMGGRIKTWKKRWFLFDRIKRKVFYFTDKSEVKLKGSVCFQAIEEVYADHLKTVKSPSPKLTFCMKTFDRTYFLVAPSPESMTIWIDVLFSGAEGYQQFYDS